MRRAFIFLIFLTIFSFAKEIDPESKLVIDKGLNEVKENCVVCHTGRFITLNGGDRKFWNTKIRLMQKAFGLWELDKKTKDLILDYLSKNYYKGWNKKKIKNKHIVPKLKLNLQ